MGLWNEKCDTWQQSFENDNKAWNLNPTASPSIANCAVSWPLPLYRVRDASEPPKSKINLEHGIRKCCLPSRQPSAWLAQSRRNHQCSENGSKAARNIRF